MERCAESSTAVEYRHAIENWKKLGLLKQTRHNISQSLQWEQMKHGVAKLNISEYMVFQIHLQYAASGQTIPRPSCDNGMWSQNEIQIVLLHVLLSHGGRQGLTQQQQHVIAIRKDIL